MKLRV